jgi:hypothetical protein
MAALGKIGFTIFPEMVSRFRGTTNIPATLNQTFTEA